MRKLSLIALRVGHPDAGAAHAAVELIAESQVSGAYQDYSVETSGPLAPAAAGSPLPYALTPFVTETTLLSSVTPLYYFTGRSDNFDPNKTSTHIRRVEQFPVGDTEISGNTSGRVANKGMEGLANEYAYELDNIGTAAKPKYGPISEILAINNEEFLVDERDGKGLADNSRAVVKKIYRISLRNAAEADISANGVTRHTLIVSNDNDFLEIYVDDGHPQGGANPNRWFVFALDGSDLPGYKPQPIETTKSCSEDHHSWDEWFRWHD